MKQIEIRLALVLYGGVSLAVYMHGVTREMLNLVRASKRHRETDGDPPDPPGTEADPEVAAYVALFRALADEVEARVVIDAVAGASAGGINGVLLARAIAHDLALDDHRDLWLANADVERLAGPPTGWTRFLKAPLVPLLDWLIARRFRLGTDDPETRRKLRCFFRARWFQPPFSGSRFAHWLFDACDAMDATGRPGESLLPRGHRLDLFVTLTDFAGHQHRIALDDPAYVEETEHRRVVAFACRRLLSGELVSELGSTDAPALVFAARATSSFPGAFPPATLAEIDHILAARRRQWPGRAAFARDGLAGPDQPDIDPETLVFVDGSVVMNKPFGPVVQALASRPANREVVRRIVYVDPQPRKTGEPVAAGRPGFFRTILASLALIPRNEPIADDLSDIEAWNRRARRMSEAIAAADPEVDRKVAGIVGDSPPTIEEVGRWRAEANEAAHRDAGYAYVSYQRLKLGGLAERLAVLVIALCTDDPREVDLRPLQTRILERLDRAQAVDGAASDAVTPPRLVEFLRGLDVDFRTRRMRFVIRRINDLYRLAELDEMEQPGDRVDELKATLYELIEETSRLWSPEAYDGPVRAAAAAAIANPTDDAALGAVLDRVAAAMDLEAIDHTLDEVFALMVLNYLTPGLRRAVTGAYIGFAFYDLITLPILQWTDLGEINEILVDRISPIDSHQPLADGVALKGTALLNFGAFFNRAWREHDYLWGRLNAADRLVGIVLAAIGERRSRHVDADRIRAGLFRAILKAESRHLKADPALVAALSAEIDARYGGPG
ncbi:MAG: patatin-like protein [Inquilinus sp.]|nr:patatin-like protein [Inquilinus sp.]